MSVHRLRRWTNIDPAMGECLLFAGVQGIIGINPGIDVLTTCHTLAVISRRDPCELSGWMGIRSYGAAMIQHDKKQARGIDWIVIGWVVARHERCRITIKRVTWFLADHLHVIMTVTVDGPCSFGPRATWLTMLLRRWINFTDFDSASQQHRVSSGVVPTSVTWTQKFACVCRSLGNHPVNYSQRVFMGQRSHLIEQCSAPVAYQGYQALLLVNRLS